MGSFIEKHSEKYIDFYDKYIYKVNIVFSLSIILQAVNDLLVWEIICSLVFEIFMVMNFFKFFFLKRRITAFAFFIIALIWLAINIWAFLFNAEFTLEL